MATPSSTAHDLQNAFDVFNQHSSVLDQTSKSLQKKVDTLGRELRLARTESLTQHMKNERLGKQLKLLLEAMPGAVVVLDANGVVRDLNSHAAKLLHRPLLKCSWSEIVSREFCADSSNNGHLKLRDGRWLNLSRNPLQNGIGEILLLSDVTKSQQMTQLRQQQERLSEIGRMTAEFAHQVRTPLATAMLGLEQIDTAHHENANVVRKIADRLNDIENMVGNMLGFAAGARAVEAPVSVAELFADTDALISGQLPGGAKLIVGEVPTELRIFANAESLKGALINLIANAAQSAPGTAKIALLAHRDNKHTTLMVADDGPGISSDLSSKIFEPFFTTRPQGTGLGLAVVKTVAEAHGGTVVCDSDSTGTTFSLQLPNANDSLLEHGS